MARKHYWQFLVNDQGTPITNAEISIHEAGTSIPAKIFTSESASTPVEIAPQVNTSSKGFFEFWIADDAEVDGYPTTKKFKISWYAAGVSTGYIDYVDIITALIEPVDESDLIDDNKNKAVSNQLAANWEAHKDWHFINDGFIHGLEPVNENSTETALNKTVSNELAHKWTSRDLTIETGDFSGGGPYTYTWSHNFAYDVHPLVSVWRGDVLVNDVTVTRTDDDTLDFSSPNNTELNVKVVF